jgi:hypothetical protein
LAEIDNKIMDGFVEYEPCTECPLERGKFCKEEIINMTQFIHVSAGPLGVWAIDGLNNVYYQTYDSSWMLIPENIIKIKQLDVGSGVWAINTADEIYVREGINSGNSTGTSWKRVYGWLMHVTSNVNYHTWGVDSKYKVFYRLGASSSNPTGDTWTGNYGWIMHICAKSSGVWGLNGINTVWYKQNTYGYQVDSTLLIDNWLQVGSVQLTYLSVGEDIVWGLNSNGDMIYRKGITSNVPIGTEWVSLSYNTGGRKIEVYKNHIWVVK